jgi:hypothetical protein
MKMKLLKRFLPVLFLSGLMVMITGAINPVSYDRKSGTVKIGTYDSRVVVIAYTRSDLFKKNLAELQEKAGILMKDDDSLKRKEGACKMITSQFLMHQMGFCTGSAMELIDLVRDKLPEVARKNGVSLLVSKWELSYSDPSVEVVDLTDEVARLFNPAGDFERVAAEIKKADPIALSDFTVEEVIDMWKDFEARDKK